MAEVQSIGVTVSVTKGLADEPREGLAQSGAPLLPGAEGFYSVGLEFVAAALAAKTAEGTLKIAREGQRAAKDQQIAEQKAQAHALSDKADAMFTQAFVSGMTSIAGGALSMSGALSSGASRYAEFTKKFGEMTSQLAQPLGTLTGGVAAQKLDAEAAMHTTRSKMAEGAADDFDALRKQAQGAIEKAASAMQALLQERQATTRTVLRA